MAIHEKENLLACMYVCTSTYIVCAFPLYQTKIRYLKSSSSEIVEKFSMFE